MAGQLTMRLARTLEIATTIGGLAGGIVAVPIAPTAIDGLFADVTPVTAVLVLRGRDEHGEVVGGGGEVGAGVPMGGGGGASRGVDSVLVGAVAAGAAEDAAEARVATGERVAGRSGARWAAPTTTSPGGVGRLPGRPAVDRSVGAVPGRSPLGPARRGRRVPRSAGDAPRHEGTDQGRRGHIASDTGRHRAGGPADLRTHMPVQWVLRSGLVVALVLLVVGLVAQLAEGGHRAVPVEMFHLLAPRPAGKPIMGLGILVPALTPAAGVISAVGSWVRGRDSQFVVVVAVPAAAVLVGWAG